MCSRMSEDSMRRFFRKVFDNIICVSVDSKVYNYDPTMFDALFRTYESHPILGTRSLIDYYVVSDYKKLTTKNFTYYSECNFENPNWRFRLIKDLEMFYAKVLDSIVMHGSCIRYLGKNILLLGARRSGKTTLTHYLSIKKKGTYIDDDCVYINEKLTIGFAMPLPIRDSTVCNDSSYFIAHTVDTDGFDRTLFLPPRYLSCVSKIDAIIFPMYNNDEKNEIRQVNEDEAFKKILSNIRSHNNMINLFNTCKQLIRGCSCFELQHTNSKNACVMIEKEVYNETLEKQHK